MNIIIMKKYIKPQTTILPIDTEPLLAGSGGASESSATFSINPADAPEADPTLDAAVKESQFDFTWL